MVNDPDWAKVLAKLYWNEGRYSATGDIEALSPQEGQEKKNRNKEALKGKLQKELDLKKADSEAVEMMLNSMQQRDHVRWQIGKSAANITLEPDGFEVAHERELTKRQDRTNRILAILTGGLVFAALVQAFAATLSVPRESKAWMVIGTAIFALLILWGIYRIFLNEPAS